MSTVQYSPEFIEKVRQVFPTSTDLHSALDKGEFSAVHNLLHRDIVTAIRALPHPRKMEDIEAIGNLDKLWLDEITAYYFGREV